MFEQQQAFLCGQSLEYMGGSGGRFSLELFKVASKMHLDQLSAYPICSILYGICNVACATTQEQNFEMYLILINLSLNNHTQLVAAALDNIVLCERNVFEFYETYGSYDEFEGIE